MNIENLQNLAVLKGHEAKFLMQKHSPEILLVAGIAGGIGAAVLACKATLEAVEIKATMLGTMEQIEKVHNDPDMVDVYSEADYTSDRNKVMVLFLLQLVRVYGPAVALGALSISALVGSNRIMNGRNVALAGAYSAVSKAYSTYRSRVRKELGDDVDEYIYRNKQIPEGLKVVNKKTGKDVKFDEVEAVLPGEENDDWDFTPSPYGVIFDPGSVQWRKDPEMNKFFLRTQERFANDKLNAQGHLFLNEVYDMLALPRTPVGAVVGWLRNRGDGFVNFDIDNPYNYNGGVWGGNKQDSVFLDFNVIGPIYEDI